MTSQFSFFKPLLLSAALAFGAAEVRSQTFGADFLPHYSSTDLGSIAGLPPLYGGLAFADSNTLIIGGNANEETGRIYQADVIRDAGTGRITGFGSATLFRGGSIGTYNDGGVVFGPGGVLFTSQWPVNRLGQTKPGSTVEDKVIDLAAAGVADSHAAINFVPASFGGAGQVKLVSWAGGEWYTAGLSADGSGTYDLTGLAQVTLDSASGNLTGGPEGFVYIAGANPGFGGKNSMLVSEYSADSVAAYEVNSNGDPIASSRRDFLTGLEGAEGAALDPVTGDFLFSTFGGGDRVILVSGFTEPLPPIPEPSTYLLFALGLTALAVRRQVRAL